MIGKSETTIRQKILEYSFESNEGHIASSFSIVETLCAIYEVDLSIDSSSSLTERLIVSKGHAAFALYAFYDYFNLALINQNQVCQNGSKLIGHVPFIPDAGFPFGSGSLGHGLPFSIGLAFKNAATSNYEQIYCLVGDGELNEGSCYEAFLLLKKFPKLPINILIDNNRSATRGLGIESFLDALRSFWGAIDVDGHSKSDIANALSANLIDGNKIIICNTVKGYPIAEMVDNPAWHHRSPSQNELSNFIKQLNDA